MTPEKEEPILVLRSTSAMPLPSPSKELIQQVSASAPRDPLRSWMKALPQLIQLYLSRWHIQWTGESLKQGYFSYVLPCRCQDGTHAILKLSPLAREAQEPRRRLNLRPRRRLNLRPRRRLNLRLRRRLNLRPLQRLRPQQPQSRLQLLNRRQPQNQLLHPLRDSKQVDCLE